MEQLRKILEKYITDPEDYKIIDKAYEFALIKHKDQKRASGEDYIVHPIEVAKILAELEVSPEVIVAGFLHDVIEDCNVKIEEINELFGEDVSYLVESLTKIKRMSSLTLEDLDNQNYRKLFIAMAKDIRVIIIKLADRLHNMRTLAYLTKEKQLRIAKATLDVYAPIAHRLGLSKIKSELENLSLFYLEPEKYDYISTRLNATEKERQSSVEMMIESLHKLLRENKMDFNIYGRAKQIYSIYRKMEKGRAFDELYDLLALRVITDTEVQCYEVLGYIHATYRPIPGRFKDYIAMPKPNMYQALHTTIVGEGGYIFEIQIKTHKMEEVAESGVAAHWKYKEGIHGGDRRLQNEIEEKLHWFRDFVSMTDEEDSNAKEYVESLKKDIFEANVYVLTPRGLVIDLPSGSTPIDFAYKVHTKVGDSAVGAVVNGQLVPLSTVLKTGDVVEIKTSKQHSYPSEGWLDFVKTSQAKNRIKKALQKKNINENKDELIDHGKDLLVEELKERGINEKDGLKIIEQEKLLSSYGYKNFEDLFFAIANKVVSPITIASKVKQKRDGEKAPIDFSKNKKKSQLVKNRFGISISGSSDMMLTLSQCCSPIPGDEIVGYISKGKGIKIHRCDCAMIANEKKRLIEASWTEDAYSASMHPVDLIIQANDRPNLLVDIMNVFSQNKISVIEISATSHKQELTATLYASILVKDAEHLRSISNILSNISNVYDVKRGQRN